MTGELAALFRAVDYDAGASLAHPGDALPLLLLVERGLLRFYQPDEAGREWNKGFLWEGGIAGPLAGDAERWPAPSGLQALEPSRVHGAPLDRVRALMRRWPELDRWSRRYADWLIESKASRLARFQRLSATARYEDFRCRHPQLCDRLALLHVASYIGVTDVTLSRIRGRLARRGVPA